jgi:hypothetical protein
MAAFDAFIETRRADLAQQGARVSVGFLGRDGFLPHGIWQDAHDSTGAYLEINRRISLVGSADTLEPLCELLSRVVKIDAATFADIVKVQPPAVMAFFAKYPDGIASGRELTDALPDLMDPREITDIAAGVRTRLLAYLRAKIPDFDSCTDLILADLGYSASVQKSLRRIFDREGINIRLHGAYLLTLDDAFDDIADDDTAEGLISDRVVTPHIKRMLIRNVALPSHAYLYTLFGANRLPPNVFGEAQCGTLQVGLFKGDGQASLEAVTVYHTGLGDIRLRIPLSGSMAVTTIALPLAKLAREGMLHGVVVQSGENTVEAAKNQAPKAVTDTRLVYAGFERSGRHIRASSD